MAFDYPSGLILPFDGPCPSGWTRFAGLDSKFAMGASSYGAIGGSTEHYHYINPGTRGTNTPIGNTATEDTQLITNTTSTQSHYHQADISTSYAENKSNYPLYIKVVFCEKD